MKASCGHEVEVVQGHNYSYTKCSHIRCGKGHRTICPACAFKRSWREMKKAGKGAVDCTPLSRLWVYRSDPDPIVNAAAHKHYKTWREPPCSRDTPYQTFARKDDWSGWCEISLNYHVIEAQANTSRGSHNWGCHRYDCTFPMPDGFMWYGRMIGENGYMRCWRTKKRVSA